MLHELKSYKYIAESVKVDGKIGAAAGLLRHALTSIGKSTPKGEAWRLVYKQLVQEMTELLRKYEHENDFVWHEKVLTKHELPQPETIKIVTSTPYQPQRSEKTLAFKLV